MLKSALVVLDGSPYSEPATQLAIDWARRYGARLLGLGVLDEPSIRAGEAVPMGANAYKRARDDVRMAEAHHRVEEILAEFRVRSVAAGVAADVLEDVGEPATCIVREAQKCDIVVLARETHFQYEAGNRADATLGGVLRASPRPVVVVPRELPEGHGVVVAYGGGRESARTLQTVQLLGLAAGEPVQVLAVHRDGAEAEALAHLAGEYLAAHGVTHRLHPVTSARRPAEVLLEEVRHSRPRLLVMGAHGHHPLRDLFETSVTRAVLRACPVPVLVGA